MGPRALRAFGSASLRRDTFSRPGRHSDKRKNLHVPAGHDTKGFGVRILIINCARRSFSKATIYQ